MRGIAYLALWWLAFRKLSRPVYHFLSRHDRAIALAFERARHGQLGLTIQWVNDLVLLSMAAMISAVLIATEQHFRLWATAKTYARRCNLAGARSAPSLLAIGLVGGLSTNAAVVGLMAAFGGARIELADAAFLASLVGLAKLLLTDGLVAVTEEFIFRGYALRALGEGLGFWPAVLITSGLFAVLHLYSADTLLGLVPIVLFSIFLCLTVRLTGSLYLAIGWHAAWDFSEDGVFGVSDSGLHKMGLLFHTTPQGPAWLSGGRIGSEGSVLSWILIALLVVVALNLSARVRGHQAGHARNRTLPAPTGEPL